MGIETICTEVVAGLRTVSGLKNVPLNPPEVMSYDTFGLVYPNSGSVQVGPAGTMKFLHNVAVDVLTVRSDMARDIARVRPLIDLVANKILSEVIPGGTFFNNAFNAFDSLQYSWIQSDYAGLDLVGYHFLMIDVKVLV